MIKQDQLRYSDRKTQKLGADLIWQYYFSIIIYLYKTGFVVVPSNRLYEGSEEKRWRK